MRGNHSLFCWRIIALTMLLMILPVHAETLEEAWREALAGNHRLKAAQEAAVQQLKAVKASRFPGLSLEAGYTALENEPAAKASLGLTPAPLQFPVGEKNSLSYQGTVTLPIYTSGRIRSGIDAAAASVEAYRANEKSNTQDLKLQIAEAYVGILRAARGLEVASSHANSLEVHTRDARNMFRKGMAARNDLLAAQVALANARQQMSQAQSAVDLARAAYNYQLGRPLDQVVSLENIPPGRFVESLATLTARAIQQRSELMVIAGQITALHRQADGIRAEARPQVALSGGYAYQQNRYQVHEGQWMLTLGMQWNIFDSGIVRHKSSAVERQAIGMQEQRDDLISAISLQVRSAWLEMQESGKRLEVTNAAIEQANENLKVTKDRYINGLSRNADVLDAEALRTLSLNNHANAHYDLVLAGLRLKRAVGDL